MSTEWASPERAREKAKREFGANGWAVLESAFEALEIVRPGSAATREQAERRIHALKHLATAKEHIDFAVERVGPGPLGAVLAGRLREATSRLEQVRKVLAAAPVVPSERRLMRDRVRGPTKDGPTPRGPGGREASGRRHDFIRLALLESGFEFERPGDPWTLSGNERGHVTLPKSWAAWARAGIAFGIDPPCTHFKEFRSRQDDWSAAYESVCRKLGDRRR